MTVNYQSKEMIYSDPLVKARAVNVYSYLVDRMNQMFTCFPSIKTIAHALHISVSTVKRAIRELKERGYILVNERFSDKKNGAQTSNLYTISENKITRDERKQNYEKILEQKMLASLNQKEALKKVLKSSKSKKQNRRKYAFINLISRIKGGFIKNDLPPSSK